MLKYLMLALLCACECALLFVTSHHVHHKTSAIPICAQHTEVIWCRIHDQYDLVLTGQPALAVAPLSQQMLVVGVAAWAVVGAMVGTVGVAMVLVGAPPDLKRRGLAIGPAPTVTISVLPAGVCSYTC